MSPIDFASGRSTFKIFTSTPRTIRGSLVNVKERVKNSSSPCFNLCGYEFRDRVDYHDSFNHDVRDNYLQEGKRSGGKYEHESKSVIL